MQIRGLSLALVLAAGSISGCSDDWLPATSGVPTTTPGSTSSGGASGEAPTTTGATTETSEEPGTSEAPTSTSTTEPSSSGGMCSIFDQDCPSGEKCTAYAPPGTFIPHGIKCVPLPANPRGHDEPCSVGPEGLGDDDCDIGSVCLDLDYDGTGFCLPYCTGDSQNPMCGGNDRTCVKLFFGYDFGNCFKQCDPLLQDCPLGEGCYMDAIKVGNTGFVCLPVVQEGKDKVFGDNCIGWSSCEPGYACVYEEFVPGCNGLCCTPWCDISEGDGPCQDVDPIMSCVPWYPEQQAPPGLENVGVCGIPQ
jgi:hypothetical protein